MGGKMREEDFDISDGMLGIYRESCETIIKNCGCSLANPLCRECPLDNVNDCGVDKAKQFIKLFEEHP